MLHTLKKGFNNKGLSLQHFGKASFHATSLSHQSFKRIGVIGAGQMGMGIAQVTASVAKLPVLIHDKSEAQIKRGLELMGSLLDKDVKKGRITEAHRDAVKANVQCVSSINDLKDVDFVIEAVSENIELKQNIFRELTKIVNPKAILATNTSSISITKIASVTDRPEKVIGMHFMNPVPVMKLIEVITGLATSEETLAATLALSKKMGKTTTLAQDVPGFVANRLLMPYLNEAVVALQENIATKEDIDTTMKLGTNMPMGPLTLADFIGLDTCLAIMKVLHNELGEDKYRPAWLLQKYVDAGWLGRKSGRGFYSY